MKLPKTFYFRAALFCMELFTIALAYPYMIADQTEFDKIGGEVCKEYEAITGYCIETEVIRFEKIDPVIIGLFIMFLTFFAGLNFRTMYMQYKKAKYGFKSTWRHD